MSSTFSGIETAKRGLNANQTALNIVGNNIANVGTEGYTRQRVDTVSMASTGAKSRYALSQSALAGQGVTVAGVAQIRDSFLDKRFRDAEADVGYYDKTVEILTDIETALDEYSSDGLKSAMTHMFNALSDLSANADEMVNASTVLTAAKGIVEVLNRFDATLSNIKDQQVYSLQTDVQEVNSLLERIANLNKSINQEVFASSIGNNASSYGSNELLDERNLLLDQLAYYGNISVSSNDDGSVKIDMNEQEIVNGTDYNKLNLVNNADGTVSLNWLSTGDNIILDSGSLKSYVDMLNGRGSNATSNENYEKGIPYYRDMIDDFSNQFMMTFNSIFPVESSGAATSTAYKTLFSTGGNNIVTAGNFQVSDEWMRNPAYIIDDSVDADGEFDNTYILKAVAAFSENIGFDTMTGTFEDYVNFYNTSQLGQQVVMYGSRQETAQSVSDSMQDNRDAVSGVSVDEEGVNLLSYQKAYNAMARVMTALDEVLDKLINGTGLVGR